MNASVQEVSPEVAENIGDDLFSGITGDLLPGSPAKPTPKAKSEPQIEEPDDNDSAVDISDLIPGAEPAEKPKAKPAKEQPAKEPEGLSPEDVADVSTLAGDELPDDLVKEEDTDKVFKGDIKAKDAFLKERAYNKTLREQLKEAQSALMAAKADENVAEEAEKYKTELEEYKKKVETLESDIGKLDLTRSPSFRQQYDDKINKLGGKMVEVLVQEGVSQDEAVQFARQVIAEQKPSVRERLIDDMAPGLKGTLAALGMQIDEVVQSRTAALEDWKATAAALDETESRKRVAEMTGKVGEYVASAIDEAKKLGNPYYIETKDAGWNEQVAKRQDALKGVLLSGDMSKVASLVAEGLTAADLRSRYAKLLKAKKEVDAELEAVVKGAPRFSGRPQAPNASMPEPKRDDVHAVPLEDAITNDLLPPKP